LFLTKSLFNKKTNKNKLLSILLVFCFLLSIFFVYNNYSLYDKSIAKILTTKIQKTTTVEGPHSEDQLYKQHIVAELKNGKDKGKKIYLINEYSDSKAYDNEFHVGNDLFVTIDYNDNGDGKLTGTILDIKRDKYLMIVSWVFIFILLLVGKMQGLLSILSLIFNALLLSFALDLYIHYSNLNLVWICAISVILFTIVTLLLVNGFNAKTYAAIIATLLGTFISLFITLIVLLITGANGLRYEELQFITRPYQIVFIAGLFIGSLGAVMDIAITMSSTIFGLYDKDNNIPIKALIKSGMEVGRDIMGTMTNILFFAYVSGSIPILVLYFKNGSPFGYTISLNLSLELARALSGGIGIVLTIPIGLYTTIYFVNRKRKTP